MSSTKRVYDKDLGVEVTLDDEPEDRNTRKTDEDRLETRGRKRMKVESSQTSSSDGNNQFSQSQQSNVTSAPTEASSFEPGLSESSEAQAGLDNERGSDDEDDYDDIDYGEDDDDDFNTNEDGEHKDDRGLSEDGSHQNFPIDYDVLVAHDEPEDYDYEPKDDDDEEEEDDDDANADGSKQSEKEQAERCQYWPSCNAGDKCTFYHPTKPCRLFPNCRFGDRCRYVHPTCKFSPNCTKKGCPFAHPMRTPRRQGPIQQALPPRCKYGFNCMNLMCKFSHQRSEPCRFGANCLLVSCAYTHPSDVVRQKPSSAFKWSAQS